MAPAVRVLAVLRCHGLKELRDLLESLPLSLDLFGIHPAVAQKSLFEQAVVKGGSLCRRDLFGLSAGLGHLALKALDLRIVAGVAGGRFAWAPVGQRFVEVVDREVGCYQSGHPQLFGHLVGGRAVAGIVDGVQERLIAKALSIFAAATGQAEKEIKAGIATEISKQKGGPVGV